MSVRFVETPVPGAYLVELEPKGDARGSFTRLYCRREFASLGLTPHVEQASVSYNAQAGTLRGLHWQAAPQEEAKLVRCERGAIYDVVADVRPGSATFGRHFGVALRAGDGRALYVPEGCAHGFLTLEDHSCVGYQISAPYAPSCARGVRYDDPTLAIRWPAPVRVMSERDVTLPALSQVYAQLRRGAA